MHMKFSWDEEKAVANERKHLVGFAMASRVFLDPNRLEKYDLEHAVNEDRWITIGLVDMTILMVVYAERRETVRLISARRATKNEQKAYYHLQARS